MLDSGTYLCVFCREADRPELVDELLRFRKALFIDEYGWDLPADEGRERDRFDTNETIHSALYFEDELVGTFRAIRTDRSYLAADVFPQLASTVPFPRQPARWEISRFGVLSRRQSRRHARANYAAMFRFAQLVGARGLVAIADLTYERFLGVLGVRTRRYGPPQIIGQDRSGRDLVAVAGEIPLGSSQGGPRFNQLMQLASNVEIIDAAQVLRPARISA